MEFEHYSFSTLSSFHTCPFMLYLEKIEGIPEKENAFAQQGSFIHSLLEGWAGGDIPKEELAQKYMDEYDIFVTAEFPRMLASKGYAGKTFEQGYDYFLNFDGFEGYKVVSAEKGYETKIAGRTFVGIIDLVLRDKKTNELVICDHKSKSMSSFKKSQDEMYRQQLLYSKFIYEETGKFPDVLMFNLFKENKCVTRPFAKEAYEEALHWAEDTIERIESCDMLDWLQTRDQDFFCTSICSAADQCPNGQWKRKK